MPLRDSLILALVSSDLITPRPYGVLLLLAPSLKAVRGARESNSYASRGVRMPLPLRPLGVLLRVLLRINPRSKRAGNLARAKEEPAIFSILYIGFKRSK